VLGALIWIEQTPGFQDVFNNAVRLLFLTKVQSEYFFSFIGPIKVKHAKTESISSSNINTSFSLF
jgi:hypothetical protein